MSYTWETVREQALLPQNKIYLNTAACGIPLQSTIGAEQTWMERYRQDPFDFIATWFSTYRVEVRNDLANFLGVSQKDISLAQNFSVPLRLLVPALPGKRVAILADDYPSLILPFAYAGKELITLQPQIENKFTEQELIKELEKHQPDWFVFSHVLYLTGQVLDINTITKACKKMGIRVLIDVTQSFGAHPISFSDIDVVLGSAYKWMMAGFGNGFCYVNSALQSYLDFSHQGAQLLTHWAENMHMEQLHLFLEPGHLDFAPFARLQQALKDQQDIGIQSIEKRISELTGQLVDGLKELQITPLGGYDMPRCGIVSIPYTSELMQKLKKRNIVCVKRGNGIRISPHIYNTPEEINILLHTLRKG